MAFIDRAARSLLMTELLSEDPDIEVVGQARGGWQALRELADPNLAVDVISTCSLLLGEQPVSTTSPDEVTVGPGDCVEFLPPFAGG